MNCWSWSASVILGMLAGWLLISVAFCLGWWISRKFNR